MFKGNILVVESFTSLFQSANCLIITFLKDKAIVSYGTQLFAILMLSRKSCHSITTLLKSPSRISIEAWYPW